MRPRGTRTQERHADGNINEELAGGMGRESGKKVHRALMGAGHRPETHRSEDRRLVRTEAAKQL